MQNLLLIGCGGFLGAILRYGVYLWVPAIPLSQTFQFPMGTLTANLAGCLLIGLFHGLSAAVEGFNEGFRLFLFTGILGSFTTFSTFGWEAHRLLQEGQHVVVVLYAIVSVGVGFLLVYAGHRAGLILAGG